MMDFIEKLRAYSPATRKLIAMCTSGVITSVVAVMWLVSVSTQGILAVGVNNTETDTAKKDGGAFSQSMMASIVSSMKESLSPEGDIVLVDENATSTLEKPVEIDATVIPF